MIDAKNMIMIGSFGRNSGKTALAEALIEKWRGSYSIIGLKVTAITEDDKGGRLCPRGGAGCGVCSGIEGDYELLRETETQGVKDTSRLLAAGADMVYWLRSTRCGLFNGFLEFSRIVADNSLIICESNSLREHVKPGVFVMMRSEEDEAVKPSAKHVAGLADFVVQNHFRASNLTDAVEQIKVERIDEAAIVCFAIYSNKT